MPLQSLTAILGLAKQASKGTLAANPTYSHGLTGGSPIVVDVAQAPNEVTAAQRVAFGLYRDAVKNGSSVETMAYMKALGLYLLGALGTDVVTGTDPYLHTYALGDLPYLSVFAKGLGAEIEAIRDCKVDELTLKWDGAKAVALSAKLAGTVFSYPASFTATTDETGSESYLVPVGGTFEVDVVGAVPASAVVTGGEITVKNNLESIDPSAQVESSDQFEARQEHSLKLTIVPDDLAMFRAAVTGADAGAAVASGVPIGSVNLQFKESNGGAGTLDVTGTKVAFMTAFPDADPKGGPIQIELAGEAVMPSGGTSPLVFALSNDVASY